MKKGIIVLAIVPFLFSCAGKGYVKVEDFNRLKEQVKRNEFLVKQTAYAVVDLKKAFKEVNEQLRKQNQINKQLFERIDEIKKETKEKKEEKKEYKIGIVRVYKGNVRNLPSIRGKVITKVSEGQKVVVLDRIGNWYQVKVNGHIGYIHRSLLNVY